MTTLVLGRHSIDVSASSLDRSALQIQVDGLVARFVEEASSPTTLGALMAGGIAYRFARVGMMGIGSSAVLRPLSMAVGLGSEVSAFELTNRSLLSLSGNSTNPNLWRWEGQGGWRQGLLNSTVTFGMLKGAGFLGREQNLIFQHAFQSTAMVAGHNMTASFGITPRPEGSLTEQFLHAEVTNLQLGAGMSLVHGMAPGLHVLERGLDVSLSVHFSTPFFRDLLGSASPELARAGIGEATGVLRPEQNPWVMQMSASEPPGEGGKGGPPRPRRGTIGYEGKSAEPREVPEEVESVHDIITTLRNLLARGKDSLKLVSPFWNESRDAEILARRLQGIPDFSSKKAFTLILERQNRQLVFYWEHDVVKWRAEPLGFRSALPSRPSHFPPSSGKHPAAPPTLSASSFDRPTPRRSSFPPALDAASERDQRLDSVLCLRPAEVLQALHLALGPPSGEVLPMATIRLNEGRLGQADLLKMVDYLSDHPIRDGQKITITWPERGGGRLTIHRQGERIQAVIKVFQQVEKVFWILLENPMMRQWGVYEDRQVRFYPFQNPLHYQQQSERELIALTQRIRPQELWILTRTREEGAVFRGSLLARLAQQALKDYSISKNRETLESLGHLHRFLERTYAFLDLGTLQTFVERLGKEDRSGYQTALGRLNETAEAEGRPLFVSLEQMPFDLPGKGLVPVKDSLRQAWVAHLFEPFPAGRSPRETAALLRDPQRLGLSLGQLFQRYMNSVQVNLEELRAEIPRETLSQILRPGRSDLPDKARSLKEEIHGRLEVLGEFSRILMGTGAFHWNFLKGVFSEESQRLRYRNFYKGFLEIPAELRLGIIFFTPDQLETLLQKSRPPMR